MAVATPHPRWETAAEPGESGKTTAVGAADRAAGGVPGAGSGIRLRAGRSLGRRQPQAVLDRHSGDCREPPQAGVERSEVVRADLAVLVDERHRDRLAIAGDVRAQLQGGLRAPLRDLLLVQSRRLRAEYDGARLPRQHRVRLATPGYGKQDCHHGEWAGEPDQAAGSRQSREHAPDITGGSVALVTSVLGVHPEDRAE